MRTGAFTVQHLAGQLAALRSAARSEAAATLVAAGFRASDQGEWHGLLELPGEFTPVAVRVRLPAEFPDVLPEVLVDPATLARRVAHVESSGKVCVVPTSGVLLDAARPAALVADALARAARELARGLAGQSDPDFQSEFLAYWLPTVAGSTYTLCDPDGPVRVLARLALEGIGAFAAGSTLIADSEQGGAAWAHRLGVTARILGDAFFVPLETSFLPPRFDEVISAGAARNLIESHARKEDGASFDRWLGTVALPATVVVALPEIMAGAGRTLIGFRIEAPGRDAVKLAQAGFRPGHVPSRRILRFASGAPVQRLKLVRVDLGFIGPRGGAADALASRTVTLVGAGAVGSEIALHLAAVGVGRLRIVDHDELMVENVHRHALGMRHVGQSKAVALCAELRSRFPHLTFDAHNVKLERLLQDDETLLTGADLVILALGEETLERRLNMLLADRLPRIHAWVEPLGIAGHVLACGMSGTVGCYECLFETDLKLGPVNWAALTAAGQHIRRSLAGCAGSFSPFSALDARRTALEAAELATRLLSDREVGSMLLTWRGDRTEFESAGYRLSARAGVVPAGTRVCVLGATFAHPGCPVCGAAASGPNQVAHPDQGGQ